MVNSPDHVPRIESLRVENYRALRHLELKKLTPLTVLLGPNGSGKSTVFDVFAFLAESFESGVSKALDHRGRLRELRSRNADGPIVIELQYREAPKTPLITYHLAIDEEQGRPVVLAEWLHWKRGSPSQPFKFLDFARGAGEVTVGESPQANDKRIHEALESPDLLAVSTLGKLAKNPRVGALRRFVSQWYFLDLIRSGGPGKLDLSPHAHLSYFGDNLPNVIHYLGEQRPGTLSTIVDRLRKHVPLFENVEVQRLADGRLALQVKDGAFDRPFDGRYVSDGTIRMLAYLTVLYDPQPPPLICIEEPESFLHPSILPALTEEWRNASAGAQVMITTHSPQFIDELRPEEVRVLHRDNQGYTQAWRAADLPGVPELVQEGGKLGRLWTERFLEVERGAQVSGRRGKRR